MDQKWQKAKWCQKDRNRRLRWIWRTRSGLTFLYIFHLDSLHTWIKTNVNRFVNSSIQASRSYFNLTCEYDLYTCSLSPVEEWKRREAEFSQKWSRDRGLGRIAQFVQCSKNLSSLGFSPSSTLFPTLPFIPIVIMHFYSICNLFFSLSINFLAGIWCCDESINSSYSFLQWYICIELE